MKTFKQGETVWVKGGYYEHRTFSEWPHMVNVDGVIPRVKDEDIRLDSDFDGNKPYVVDISELTTDHDVLVFGQWRRFKKWEFGYLYVQGDEWYFPSGVICVRNRPKPKTAEDIIHECLNDEGAEAVHIADALRDAGLLVEAEK